MPPLPRTCKITGKQFLVSELEQKLREQFGVELPDVHPHERLRWLMNLRNLLVLYYDTCDLCGKRIVSQWGENPVFPVYCPACWWSDKWEPQHMDLDLERPFFDQLKELVEKSPHISQQLLDPENSDFCNQATKLKNCYMTFNVTFGEDCYYVLGGISLRNCVDTVLADDSEFLYDSVNCKKSYRVFWSELAINCTECNFVYDCVDCSNCTLATGLRHKSYVFLNEQLTKEEYEKKVADLASGDVVVIERYRVEYARLKKAYPKRYMVGARNEDVTGNIIFDSKNLVDCYHALKCEDSANLFNIWNTKDSLDVVAFGGVGMERIYSSTGIGHQCMNVKYCVNSYQGSHDIEYCFNVVTSSECFGCAFGKKFEYSILNKRYEPDEYKKLVAQLKQKMQERGEYGNMFRADLIPHAYNESQAQIVFPLTQAEAEKRGFRWKEKKIPQVPPDQVINPEKNIKDLTWEELSGKVLLCTETGRPFKLVQPEFEFYKKFNLPLPRLHPEVRLLKKYPRELMFNMHTARCKQCGVELETSMLEGEDVLCEEHYQQAVNA